MIAGIDPGLTGAIVLLEGEEVVDYLLTPTLQSATRKKVDVVRVFEFLEQYPIEHAYIEQVSGMKGQGAGSAFTFGRATGAVEACVAISAVPYTHVPPGTWKRRAGLLRAGKDGARSRALELWPKLDVLRLKGKGQAVGDALMIARHGTD